MDKNLIALIGVCACAIGLMLTAIPVPLMDAEWPPSERCLAVAKQEDDSAARQMLLQTRFSSMRERVILGGGTTGTVTRSCATQCSECYV